MQTVEQILADVQIYADAVMPALSDQQQKDVQEYVDLLTELFKDDESNAPDMLVQIRAAQEELGTEEFQKRWATMLEGVNVG